jgi:hypothetical protein
MYTITINQAMNFKVQSFLPLYNNGSNKAALIDSYYPSEHKIVYQFNDEAKIRSAKVRIGCSGRHFIILRGRRYYCDQAKSISYYQLWLDGLI